MSDFTPEVRNSAMWSGDARKMANGKSAQVYLEKIGELALEDISDKENVQWGHHLQDTIARVAADRMGVRIKNADYALTHPQHEWMRSHFDAITEDGKHLLEIKNYHNSNRSKFGENGSIDIPQADYAQCLHEATVHRVERVTLCVLFGGQELVLFPLEFTDAHKEALIQQEADLWAKVQLKEPPKPEDFDSAKLLYRNDDGSKLIAPPNVAKMCHDIKSLKAKIKELEEIESQWMAQVCSFMQSSSELLDLQGHKLATWKESAGRKTFDSKRFQAEMPKVYEQYVTTSAGSRRFLLK